MNNINHKSKTIIQRFSHSINISHLEKETRRWFYLGLIIAVLFHGIMAVFWKQRHSISVEPNTRPAVRLKLYTIPPQNTYTMQRKHPVQNKQYERYTVPRNTDLVSPQYKQSGSSEPLFELNVHDKDESGVNQPVIIPIEPFPQIDIGTGMESWVKRLNDNELMFSDELLDVDLFDVGRHKALIVVDPNDRHNIKGFLHIPRAVNLRGPTKTSLAANNIEEFRDIVMSSYTGVKIKIDPPIFLDSRELHDYPFLLMTASKPFDHLTTAESDNFREYLNIGGFVFIEAIGRPTASEGIPPSALSLRQMIKDTVRSENRFRLLSHDHELFHCFFDVPVKDGYNHYNSSYLSLNKQPRNYIEGIFIGNRLAIIYSDKGYSYRWGMNGLLQPKHIGLNSFIYALRQAGGNTEHLVDMSTTTIQTSRIWWDYDKRMLYRHTERRQP